MSDIDLWANFLVNEKLVPVQLETEDTMNLISLCEKLASIRPPKITQHKDKIESRRFVVEAAMDLGIDLADIKNKKGKRVIGRGLLDVWNIVYATRFGSAYGTASLREAHRRDIKMKLSKDK